MTDLEAMAKKVRRRIIEIAYDTQAAHIGSCLSCVDILVALYFREMKDDDIFILSKGHAALAWYVVLNEKGIMSDEILSTYLQDGGLEAHPKRGYPGVVCSTGSLGHGLPMAVGISYALKLQGSTRRVFCLLGDGECQEGSVSEAADFAAENDVSNLFAFVDRNALQGYRKAWVDVDKFRALGWDVWKPLDIIDMLEHFATWPDKHLSGHPVAVICDTTKGKGVSYMEDEMKWHYYKLTEEQRDQALKELS
jgi:transketolase